MKLLYSSENKQTGEYVENYKIQPLLKMGWKFSNQYFSESFALCYDLIYDPESPAKFHVKRILKEVDVAWVGWECDSEAWLVELISGEIKLLTTNHGRIIEITQDFLYNKINEYQEMIESYETIFEMMIREK